jgi:uncharacterized protein (TIGR02145 family)
LFYNNISHSLKEVVMKLRTWLVQGRALLLAAVTVLAVGTGDVLAQGTFTDRRDGQRYRTVKIGSLTWMAENLKYDKISGFCYGGDKKKCKQYGGLYARREADNCPRGWELPKAEDWDELVRVSGGKSAGQALKSVSGGWSNNGGGTDEFGFSALPGGMGHYAEKYWYSGADSFGNWWENGDYGENAYFRWMSFRRDSVGRNYTFSRNELSVRCVCRAENCD